MFALSFVLWLIGCLLLQGWKYYKHHHFVAEEEDNTEERATMFEDESTAKVVPSEAKTTKVDDDGEMLKELNEEPNNDSMKVRPCLASTHRGGYFESGKIL